MYAHTFHFEKKAWIKALNPKINIQVYSSYNLTKEKYRKQQTITTCPYNIEIKDGRNSFSVVLF